ncbi:MAG: HD domain-containing protein [Candidatus Pacebacteria bacterium]|nr:HD domain-containing protein [Candidatus Paceibacterota bacterium]MDD4074053.1 HD domain-containing protein [Candidatus Paceibacterota bacterium]
MIKKIEKEAKKYFESSSGCHDWSHVERVKKLALLIGKKEKADLFVLEIASLLHDIKRKEEMELKGSFCHAIEGEKEAKKILDKYDISDEQKKNICHCIRTHRYRNNDMPETIEAKVLFDADKLDSIGAIGLARAFLFAGSSGSCNLYTNNEKKIAKLKKDMSFTKEDSAILEYEIKLKKIKNEMMTKTGKEMAKDRHNYMVEFIKRFWIEVKGKK